MENKILIDVHEDQKIVDLLIKENIPHEVKHLEIGDYWLSNELIIERKSIQDFVGSSYGHLQEQIKNMLENKEQFKQTLIVLIGSYDDLFWMRYKVNEASYIGMLSSITMKYKVSILHFKKPQQFIKYLASCLSKLESNNIIDVTKLKRLQSKDNTPLSLLCALPNISQTKAKQILEKYDIKLTLINKENSVSIVNKNEFNEKMKEIDGVGKKIIENISNYFSLI